MYRLAIGQYLGKSNSANRGGDFAIQGTNRNLGEEISYANNSKFAHYTGIGKKQYNEKVFERPIIESKLEKNIQYKPLGRDSITTNPLGKNLMDIMNMYRRN